MTAFIDDGFIRLGNLQVLFTGTVAAALLEGQAHLDALTAHAQTVGTPAPQPSPVARIVVESGMDVALPAQPAPPTLEEAKAAKRQELQLAFINELNSGFQSAALGATHIYDSEAHNRENLIGAVIANNATSYTCDDGLGTPGSKQSRPHTPAQLLVVLRDGKSIKEALIGQLRGKRTVVDGAVNVTSVEAVTWSI